MNGGAEDVRRGWKMYANCVYLVLVLLRFADD